jgi:hypothetical protein
MHKKIRELAQKEGVSMNQLINSAVSEKLSALLTEEYLKEKGKLGSREKFDNVLSKVPDEEPEKRDKL